METTLDSEKQLSNQRGRLAIADAAVSGYEIHAGITTGPALDNPALYLPRGADGALSADGQILGTYLHGLFESPPACAALLGWAGLDQAPTFDYRALRDAAIDRLADAVEEHLDGKRLLELLGRTA